MLEIYAIVGPTGVGKTQLSIQLAKKIDAEIISLDSMQIYKHLNIGTAKISEEEKEGVPHHLIDIVEPQLNFSVFEYVDLATQIIKDINQRGKKIILVGGTGLYFESLIYNYTFSNVIDLSLRKKLEEELKNIGEVAFYNKLKELDKDEAAKIHPNNKKRLIRALEICLLSKSNKTQRTDEKVLRYNLKGVFLNCDRNKLYETINQRVDLIFEYGLLDELNYLINELKLNFQMQSMKAIGYREFENYYNNQSTIDEVKDLIKLDSRHYAKRQITWFKRYDFLKEIHVDKVSEEEILKYFCEE